MNIETQRLLLIACTKEITEAVLAGDNAIKELLNVNIPTKWTEFGEPAFRFTLARLSEQPDEFMWWAYLPIYKADNMLVGSCGFKGVPTDTGMVEIGYEVAESYRNKGLATEFATALIDFAFSHPQVTMVQAHTLAVENASCAVLQRCGMQKMETLEDPDDGLIWRWELKRNS
ncbi:MAG: GNAT family N-acetyltransferase [Sphingobacteriales bacterium JAD_PAG50586_3]|nr:MAG: GNAT family N-acetyltransferase [Sphingobacteriales bacterium JAD_PAG50586_3]